MLAAARAAATRVAVGVPMRLRPVLPSTVAMDSRRGAYSWESRAEAERMRIHENKLHEEADIYDEPLIYDSDPYILPHRALGALLLMFAGLGGVYGLAVLYDAPSRNPAVPRELPYNRPAVQTIDLVRLLVPKSPRPDAK
eukprot:c28377_g1_i1.p2 GENE.c28377_g1_i1~~c28377_g1_i1.p2  ORF type:complete len:150 (-),score=17.05 c28377_g1_i1:4-423(-)